MPWNTGTKTAKKSNDQDCDQNKCNRNDNHHTQVRESIFHHGSKALDWDFNE